jgi:hypothetical protein
VIMMNIKQFLKPDWRKIVIFVIIFSLLPVFPYYNIQLQCFAGPCPPIVEYKSLIELQSLGTNYFNDLGRVFLNVPYHLIILILGLLISYLISCLIIWIYYKAKKKK